MGRKKTTKTKSKKPSTKNPNSNKPSTKTPNTASTTTTAREAKDIIPIPQIPEDIILDILSRLPVKTLLRFRSVCKRWLSIIHSPTFIDLQLTHSQTRSSPPKVLMGLYVLPHNKRYLYSASLEGGPPDCLLALPPGTRVPYVSESVYGLVCYYNGNNIYVISPGTRSLTTLPASQGKDTNTKLDGCGFKCRTFSYYALGFDPNYYVYKVLHIRVNRHDCARLVYNIEYQVFTMKFGSKQPKVLESTSHAGNSTNSWRKITHIPPFPFRRLGESVFVNGSIHWICTKVSRERVLLVFDVAAEIFRWMPLPDGVSYLPTLRKIGGGLALLNDDSGKKIWMLEEFDNIWVETTLVVPREYQILFPIFSPSGTMYKSEMVYFSRTISYPLDTFDHKIKKARPIKTGESRILGNVSVTSHVDGLVWLSS